MDQFNYQLNCHGCGKFFKPHHLCQMYCTEECRYQHYKHPAYRNMFGETLEEATARRKQHWSDEMKRRRAREREHKAVQTAHLFPVVFIAFDDLVKRTFGEKGKGLGNNP